MVKVIVMRISFKVMIILVIIFVFDCLDCGVGVDFMIGFGLIESIFFLFLCLIVVVFFLVILVMNEVFIGVGLFLLVVLIIVYLIWVFLLIFFGLEGM